MASSTEPALIAGPTSSLGSFSKQQLRRVFQLLYTSRRIDDKEVVLKRQNRIFFQISGAGHEMIQIAAGLHLKPGHDWVYPYYRDRALSLALGVTPYEMFLQAVGAASDPASGGRQMPTHFSFPNLNIVSPSSATGTQFGQAVGCAEASRYLHPDSDEITLACSGDGATSEGEFWEAMNAACLLQAPLIFLIQDNGYAISVPVEHQTAGGKISRLVSAFPGLFVQEVDGTDFAASYRAMEAAAGYCRRRKGPALIHAHVIRPYSHSLSDEEKTYKTPEERAREAETDPMSRFPELLVDSGIFHPSEIRAMTAEIEAQLDLDVDRALAAAKPDPSTALLYLYSPDVDPSSDRFSTEPVFTGDPRTMVDSVNMTLAEEMRRDPQVLVFGEDVADCSRVGHLEEIKGKGGVFKATFGLQREFGYDRCFNTPIAEANIVGRAIGLATRGLRPVAEIQFFDYIWLAMMQFRDEMASLRWRSNNGFSCPLVVRVPIGGYLNGGSIYHSQSGESIFTHIPGLRVVMPSNSLDACGLLRTAIRCDDPVLFLEHKKLYREPYNRSPHPGPDYLVPFGKAKRVKEGNRLTIVTYGALVQKSLLAAQEIDKTERDAVEILDLRSLSPYDWEAIADSVGKTGRLLVVYEDNLSWGFGAEIAARAADELFEFLDAPVRRVAAQDTWIGYSPPLEKAILPQTEDIEAALRNLLLY